MSTLKDVARVAGISVSTVSYVLNGKKKVREETYRRILRAVEETGYVPNQMARGLKTRKSLSIGVVVPDISNVFFAEVVRGVEDTVSPHNYSIILCNTDNSAEREDRYVGTLLSKDIDGIIFISASKSIQRFSERTDLPIVLVDRKSDEKFMSVTTDSFSGGRLAGEHLIARGRRRMLIATGPLYIKSYADRVQGFRAALARQGLELLVLEYDLDDEKFPNLLKQAFRAHPQIDALFACNDMMAVSALRALSELGLRVPQDVSVVGYDDIALSKHIFPALTTIAQPKYQLGVEAAKMLLGRLAGEEGVTAQKVFQPALVVRESS